MTKWNSTAGKIIDFEFFLSETDTVTDDGKERLFFSEKIEPFLKTGRKQKKRAVLLHWIEARKSEITATSPGRIIDAALSLAAVIIIAASFFAGMGATGAYLQYSGKTPVNITLFLSLFAGVPIIMICFSITALFPFSKMTPLFCRLPYILTTSLITRTADRFLQRLPAEKRLRIKAFKGNLKAGHENSGRLIFRSIFRIFQAGGLMFSTGILLATLFKITTTDIAFGWQTTIRTASDTVSTIIQTIAAPWSWFIPAHIATPSTAQIEGSRIILKDGITILASSDMAAWWPFLCLTILFYTVLPRLVLLIIAVYMEKKEFSKIIDSSIPGDRLFKIMTKPGLTTAGNHTAEKKSPNKTIEKSAGYDTNKSRPIMGKISLLIHEDLASSGLKEPILKYTEKTVGTIEKTEIITCDEEEDRQILLALKNLSKTESKPAPVLVFESWRPPIKEILDYIITFRKTTPSELPLLLMLIGKPTPEPPGFLPVPDDDLKLWQLKIRTLGAEDITLIRHEIKSNGAPK